MQKLQFTVLIPVFNTPAEALMAATMSVSMWRQTPGAYEPYEIILIDDGSRNKPTRDMLGVLGEMPNIHVVRMDENQGTSVALNYGHSMVRTPYVAVMGSQDESHRDRFRLQADYLLAHPEVDVLGGQIFSYLDGDLTRAPLWRSNHPARYTSPRGDCWYVNHGTVMYRQDAVMAVRGYDKQFRRGQDVDLWRRMYAAGKVFHNLPQVLYAWRKDQPK